MLLAGGSGFRQRRGFRHPAPQRTVYHFVFQHQFDVIDNHARLPLGASGRRRHYVRLRHGSADDGRATGFGFANQLDYGGVFLASSEAVGSSSSRMG